MRALPMMPINVPSSRRNLVQFLGQGHERPILKLAQETPPKLGFIELRVRCALARLVSSDGVPDHPQRTVSAVSIDRSTARQWLCKTLTQTKELAVGTAIIRSGSSGHFSIEWRF